MPSIDPNLYALSISLDLDTSGATDMLDAFDDHILKIEQDITSAAQKSIGEVEDFATQAVKSLDAMKDVLGSLNITQQLTQDQKKWNKLSEELNELHIEEKDLVDEMFKMWEKYPILLKEKNKLHTEEGDLLDEEGDLVKTLGLNFHQVLDTVKNVGAVLWGTYHTLKGWASQLAQIDALSENFYTTNYRLYGTQQAMVQQARLLATESGVFLDRMLVAMKVLGDLRIPREEMEKYAKSIGQVERITGVTVESLAKYSYNLRSIGWNADKTSAHLMMLAEQQRKFGLSTEDMTRLLDDSSIKLWKLKAMIGGEMNLDEFRTLQMELMGLSKELGLGVDVGKEFEQIMNNPDKFVLFRQAMDEGEVGAEAYRNALLRMGAQEMKHLKDLEAQGQTSSEAMAAWTYNMAAIAESYGVSEDMLNYSLELAKIAEGHENGLQTAEEWDAAMSGFANNGVNLWTEATKGLYRQLGRLYDAISNLLGYAIQPLADGLAEVIKYLTWFIQKITAVVAWLNKMYNWLAEVIPGFKVMTGFIAVGIVVLGGFILALGALAITFGLIPNLIKLFTRAIIGFFRGLGLGLAAFAKAVAKHTFTLLQLAVSFALIGAGMWLMAQAFQIITAKGWEGIAMFTVLLGVMLLFAIGLVALGAAATAVAPGLLALGATIALIGLGMMLAGVGLYLMALSLEMIATHGLQASLGIVALAGALGVLALAGYFGAAGLAIVAVALWAIAIPVLLLGLGFQMLAGAIGVLTFEAVTGAAIALLVGAVIMLAAGAILLPASVLLVAAGSLLIAASALLMAGSLVLIVAAVLLGVASVILAVGAVLFFGAAIAVLGGALMIFISGMMVLVGATSLVAGLGLLIVAAAMMAAVATALWFGSFALASGAAAIAPAAAVIFAAGLAILTGGGMFLVGALLLYFGAEVFAKTGEILTIGALAILASAEYLIQAVYMMIQFGALATYAASSMALGAFTLISATTILWISAAYLMSVSLVLGAAGVALVFAGFMLYLGSIWIGAAINRMSKQSDDFYKFAEAMGMIAKGIKAIMMLKTRSLIDVANAMAIAAPIMKKAVASLDGIGDDFTRAMSGFDADKTDIHKIAPILNNLSDSLGKLEINTEPLDKIRTSLDLINQAIIQLDDNAAKLVKDLSDFGPALEQQAEQIEMAAQRIQEAVENRGVPAMRAAQDAGLAAVQQGDVIATVQVLPNQEGREQTRDQELAEARNTHLAKLVELLEAMTANEDVKDMRELLAAILPAIGDADSSELVNKMNQWS